MISVRRSTSPMIDVTSRRGLLAAFGDLVAQQLGVQADRRQRVADLVGDVRRHPPDGGQPLRPDQALLALLDRVGHRVELAREIADLVARGDARPLRVVAARPAAARGRAAPTAAAASQREQEHRARHRQPRRAERDRHRQRRLAVVRQALRDLAALAAQRPPHPVQVVRQRREVALELGPRLRIDGGRGRPQLARDAVQLRARARRPAVAGSRSPAAATTAAPSRGSDRSRPARRRGACAPCAAQAADSDRGAPSFRAPAPGRSRSATSRPRRPTPAVPDTPRSRRRPAGRDRTPAA